jgi:hypothetical protein
VTTEQALHRHFLANGLLGAHATTEDWYAGNVVWLRVGSLRIPFPILDRHGPIVLHDLHHLIAGYPPSWTGEIELAGWELGSGGCRWHLLYWLDRLTFLAAGLVTAPRATLRALRRGLRHRNLFDRDPAEILGHDVDEVRGWVLGPDAGREDRC